MLELRCSGGPYDIGHAHGSGAKSQVHGSIAFYTALFQKTCSMNWEQVTREASRYIEPLQKSCSRYLDELNGLAEGAGVHFTDVLALNVRTEIMFGLFTAPSQVDIPSDGCTALGWIGDSGESFIAQNWDWQRDQGPNLVVCHVSQPGTGIPDFSMVTEAGIIGKIGLNSAGVGCCLNAIRARGVDPTRLPVHFALRRVLESTSRKSAIEKIRSVGVAGSAHILIGDETGASGLECTSIGVKELAMNENKRVYHTNHLVLEHPDVDEPPWLKDSAVRLSRIHQLAASADIGGGPGLESALEMLKDEEDGPCSINRRQEGVSTFQTLFTIVMNLSRRTSTVKVGRPSEDGDVVELSF